jgi:hypothetical protein
LLGSSVVHAPDRIRIKPCSSPVARDFVLNEPPERHAERRCAEANAVGLPRLVADLDARNSAAWGVYALTFLSSLLKLPTAPTGVAPARSTLS